MGGQRVRRGLHPSDHGTSRHGPGPVLTRFPLVSRLAPDRISAFGPGRPALVANLHPGNHSHRPLYPEKNMELFILLFAVPAAVVAIILAIMKLIKRTSRIECTNCHHSCDSSSIKWKEREYLDMKDRKRKRRFTTKCKVCGRQITKFKLIEKCPPSPGGDSAWGAVG